VTPLANGENLRNSSKRIIDANPTIINIKTFFTLRLKN